MKNLKKRFFEKVKKTKTCWLWTGSKVQGYGSFYANGKLHRAHRWSFENLKGIKIKKGNFICHACDTPACVRPSHLWQGTHQENLDDSKRKGRLHTPERREKLRKNILKHMVNWTVRSGEKHSMAKLKESQAIEIIKSKVRTGLLSKKYGVCDTIIRDIRRGKYWNTPACKAARAKISEVGG